MPEMDGLQTIEKFRSTVDPKCETPIILLHSSSDEINLRTVCKKLKIRFQLLKPVKSNELYYYVKNIHTKNLTITNQEQSYNLQSSIEQIKLDKKPSILIADDSVMNLYLARSIISKLIPGCLTLEASDGMKAFELVKKHNPDIILMDIQMPVLDGFKSTLKIRKWEAETNRQRQSIIIALTAGALKEQVKEARSVGMNDYLTKPLDVKKLGSCLKNHLSGENNTKSDSSEENNNSDSTIFDRESLLEGLMDDEELLKSIVETGLNNVREMMSNFNKAVDQKCINDIKATAHSIKGAAANLRLKTISMISKQIESDTKDEDLESIMTLAEKLNKEWKAAETILTQEL